MPGTKVYLYDKFGAGILIKHVNKIRRDIIKLCKKNSISILRPVDLMIGNEKINIIKNILVKAFSPYLIYIFGSTIKNRDRGESDIDIAILTDRRVDEYKLFILSQKLADILKKEVDLIDLNKASTVFKIQVIKTGKLIYNSDNLKKMYFQMKTMKDYAILNEERQEVIDKIKSRGARI